MALIGYVRTSSVRLSLEVQRTKLSHCQKIFQEEFSNTSRKQPQLAACIEYIRRGDILVVTRLDRLARSTFHLCQIIAELERKQASLHALDEGIDTCNEEGQSFLKMLKIIAEFEQETRAERQTDGIQKAIARGVVFGRHNKLTPEQIAELRQKRRRGVMIKNLVQEYNLAKSTIYRYLDGITPGT